MLKLEQKVIKINMSEIITVPTNHNELPDAVPVSGQIDYNSQVVTAEQILEKLEKSEPPIKDSEGVARRTYVVNGREITFLNPQEISSLPDRDVYYAAADIVPPIIPLEGDSLEGQLDSLKDTDNSRHKNNIDNKNKLMAVPATPLGVVEAVIRLGTREMEELRDMLIHKKYTDSGVLTFIDSFIATTSIKDDGNFADEFNVSDGLALLVSAFCGDKDSRRIVTNRLEALYAQESKRLQDRRSSQELEDSVTVDQLCLVHSTTHPPELDENGNATLYPTGHYNNGVYPRSTVHFTCNSLVAPTNAWGQDSWGIDNTVLIANLGKTLKLNGYTGDDGKVIYGFETLAGVDSWVSLKPGESIKLPAVIVESVAEGQEEPIVRIGNKVKILHKKGYSKEQMAAIIKDLPSLRSNTDISPEKLREEYIKKIMVELGADKSMIDQPSADGHGMASGRIDGEISSLASRLGLDLHRHFGSPEYLSENYGYNALRFYGKNGLTLGGIISPGTPLNALRYRAVVGAFNSFTDDDQLEYSSGASGNLIFR